MTVTITSLTVAAPGYSSITEKDSGYGYGYGFGARALESSEDELSPTKLGSERSLSDGTHVSLVMASYLFFEAKDGTACTQVTDFKERAGTVTITSRVLVGVDYVVTPAVEQSLEVTGPDLTYDA